jgi:hypothetical protein
MGLRCFKIVLTHSVHNYEDSVKFINVTIVRSSFRINKEQQSIEMVQVIH